MSVKKVYDKIAVFLCDPQKVFYSALVIGCFCTVFMTLFLDDLYADTANVYARFAREIGNGNWSGGIVARVPMLNIVLGGLLAMTGLEAATALTLLAGIFYCATCFPLRRFLERYVTPIQASWGCMLYITAPKMIRFGCAPLLESTRIFFLIAAIWLFFETMERPDWKKGILFGLSCGFLTVSRGEGLPAALALLLGFLPWILLFCRNGKFKKQTAVWALSLVFAALACIPFCAMNYSKTGYFVTDMRVVEFIDLILGRSTAIHHECDFAKIISDLFRGGYELYWVLAAAGMIVIIRQKKLRWDYLLFCGMSLVHFVMYIAIVSSHRYYLFVIPLFMMFTITGIDLVRRKVVEYLPAKLLPFVALLCGAVLVMHVVNGIDRAFSKRGKEHKKIGAYIEEYGKKHFPDRRLRVLEEGITEVVYWSKAFHVNGYDQDPVDAATYSDFDLAVCLPRSRAVLKRYGADSRYAMSQTGADLSLQEKAG